ncbi:MAG: response regulator [Novosphingobium sp.]
MPLKSAIAPQLPYLRRYARALTGSQSLGDGAVREVLEALLQAPDEFDRDRPERLELYRVFHRLWQGMGSVGVAEGLVARLSLHVREALLLTAIEGFSVAEAAEILGSSVADVTAQIVAARAAIKDALHASVMIIEDEPIIALHIRSIVEELGHSVAGVARTRAEAVALAARVQPELVLADISLADGSSGIDAVREILEVLDVPAIFITAFPERLLTGEGYEPTYLITKPFEPETVMAAIGQAVMIHRETHGARTPADHVKSEIAPNPRKHYDSPEQLLADPDLTDEEKQSQLVDWKYEMDRRLESESEGMSAQDAISARKEGRLADEASQTQSAVTEIADKNSAA